MELTYHACLSRNTLNNFSNLEFRLDWILKSLLSYNTSQISLPWYLQYEAFRCIYNHYFKYQLVFAVL